MGLQTSYSCSTDHDFNGNRAFCGELQQHIKKFVIFKLSAESFREDFVKILYITFSRMCIL